MNGVVRTNELRKAKVLIVKNASYKIIPSFKAASFTILFFFSFLFLFFSPLSKDNVKNTDCLSFRNLQYLYDGPLDILRAFICVTSYPNECVKTSLRDNNERKKVQRERKQKKKKDIKKKQREKSHIGNFLTGGIRSLCKIFERG